MKQNTFIVKLDKLHSTKFKKCPCRITDIPANKCPCDELTTTGKCICRIFVTAESSKEAAK